MMYQESLRPVRDAAPLAARAVPAPGLTHPPLAPAPPPTLATTTSLPCAT